MVTPSKIEVEKLVILALQSGSYVASLPEKICKFLATFNDQEVCRFSWDDVADKESIRELVLSKISVIEHAGYALLAHRRKV